MQLVLIAMGVLVTLALAVAATLFWWVRRVRRRTEVWAMRLAEAVALEQTGQLEGAVAKLQETLDVAGQHPGIQGVLAARAVAPHLARVMFRKGDLDAAAELTADLLEAARTSS